MDALRDIINPSYPYFAKSLDAKFIEVLCIEELSLYLWYPRGDDRVGEALDHLENVRTLIFSGSAVQPSYLRAFVAGGAGNTSKWRCPKLGTLFVHRLHAKHHRYDAFSELCSVALEGNLAVSPF